MDRWSLAINYNIMIKQFVLAPSTVSYNIYVGKYKLSRAESVLISGQNVTEILRGRRKVDLVLLNGWYNDRDWKQIMGVYEAIVAERFCVQLFDYNLDSFTKERKEKWLEDTKRIVASSKS